MAATIRVTCTYGVPHELEGVNAIEWARKLNSSFHPPHATVDGQESTLKWGEPTDLEVAPGRSHKLEVYFRVFDVLRICGAELTIDPLRDGQTQAYQYVVEFTDRYLKRGHLSPIGS